VASLVCLAGLLLAAALFTRFPILFLASYFIIVLLALTHIWVWLIQRGLHVRREVTPRIFHDETARVTIRIRNRSLLPIAWLSIREGLPIRIATHDALRRVVRIGPRSSAEITYTLTGNSRGYHRLGPLEVRFGDVFGIASKDLIIDTAEFIIVYPEIVPVEAFHIESNTPFGDMRSHQQIYEDPLRVVGSRDYQPGDSERLINWKATAAAGRLLVRRLEPAVSHEVQISLDLNPESYSRQWKDSASEMSVTVATSLSSFMLQNRQAVGIVSNGLDPIYLQGDRVASQTEARRRMGNAIPHIPMGRGRSHLMSCLDLLARVELLAGENPSNLVTTSSQNLAWGTTSIIITGLRSDNLFAALTAQRKLGHRVICIFTDPSAATLSVSAARAAGLGSFAITSKDHMRVWRDDRTSV
jgi:uncharacterized protein (DUF58 family)